MRQRIGVVLSGVLVLLVIMLAPCAIANTHHASNGQCQTKAAKHTVAQFGQVKVQCDKKENCSCIEPRGRLFGFLPIRHASGGFRCLTPAEMGVIPQMPPMRRRR